MTTPASSSVPVKKEEAPAASETSTVRVQVGLLDRLMNLAGELVLVRNQVLQHAIQSEDYNFHQLSQKLDLVTTELQEEVMKTRMQPIGSVLSKFQRVVRDLSRDLGKQVELEITGADTELDKTLIEAIKDPLTHIVRNSCDHGVENAEERKAAQKDPVGRIHIRAFQESGQVIVEIEDDGRGLDADRLKAKALEKGLMSADRLGRMGEQEAFEIIFLPGFSTAQQVSSVSGRGVGMDVVRTNIEKIGGRVHIQSKKGNGTLLRLQIPLTLAIVPALLVESGGDLFCIPQLKLVELVRYEKESHSLRLENLAGRPMLRLRGKILPLVSLQESLQGKNWNPSEQDQDWNIVILANDHQVFGLVVERILDTADIVVKPLTAFFKSLQVYAGATILGDGRVSLILDTTGLANRAHFELRQENGRSMATEKAKRHLITETQEFLSFSLRGPGLYVMPLCLVQRLEEFSYEDIEYAGDRRVVQYRNSVLPLLSIEKFLGKEEKNNELPRSGNFPVIVVQKRGRLFGLMVQEILDVVTSAGSVEENIQAKAGVMGSLIIQDNVMTVLDVLEIIESNIGTKEKGLETNGASSNGTKKKHRHLKILFAEDTAFFARQVAKVLSAEGHAVTHVMNGQEAWDKLAENLEPFDLVLTDIEMPQMNGFELAEKVRAEGKKKDIPMIALTTRFREVDVERGRKVGFDEYLEKLKTEELLNALDKVVVQGRA